LAIWFFLGLNCFINVEECYWLMDPRGHHPYTKNFVLSLIMFLPVVLQDTLFFRSLLFNFTLLTLRDDVGWWVPDVSLSVQEMCAILILLSVILQATFLFQPLCLLNFLCDKFEGPCWQMSLRCKLISTTL
jgi:hypothetical protein